MGVSNQKIIIVNKQQYGQNYLRIGNEEWKKAYKILKPSSFALYLYLASQEGNTLALGAVLIEQILGIKKSAYHMAVNELEENGYLKKEEGNTFIFTTKSNK